MTTTHPVDPFGQLCVAAEVLHARAQRLSAAGQGRAGREVRDCARYIEERFGDGLDLPSQPVLQLPKLVAVGESWLEGLRLSGATDDGLLMMLSVLKSDAEKRRHKAKEVR